MIQKHFRILGTDGCYFFCLWKIARDRTGVHVDPYRLYWESVRAGYLTEDCWVQDPTGVLALATGQTDWKIRHESPTYQPKEGEIEILRYEWRTPTGRLSHFILPGWDPYGESQTVKNGELVSKRILWRGGV